jgi:hypothetical protein
MQQRRQLGSASLLRIDRIQSNIVGLRRKKILKLGKGEEFLVKKL